MDSNPMVSSLLNKLANYTNLSQGVVEHEEDEDSRRREVKVRAPPPAPPPRASPPPTLPQDPGCGLLSPTLFLSPGAVTLLPLPGSCFLGGCLFLGVRPQLRPAAVRVLCRDLGAVLEEPPRCPGEAVG